MKGTTVNGLNKAAKEIYRANALKGFWDKERNVGEMLMLVTSELGEAMESFRKGRCVELKHHKPEIVEASDYAEWFSKNVKDTFEDEIADSVIRLLDMCGGLDIDLEKHILLKTAYNESRPRLHGKNF